MSVSLRLEVRRIVVSASMRMLTNSLLSVLHGGSVVSLYDYHDQIMPHFVAGQIFYISFYIR